VESSCEFGIEPSGSMKCWETTECPIHYSPTIPPFDAMQPEIRVASLKKLKLNSVALVRERTILTERLPHVGEVSANVCGYRVPRGQCDVSPRP
jgi:hypothetical protein